MTTPPDFFQSPPRLGNQYEEDVLLKAYLTRKFAAERLHEIEPDMRAMGARAVGDVAALGDQAEAQPPRHVPYDAWGRRVDRIETSDAWRALDRISAEEGLVAIGYERKLGELSRVYQFAKLYLFHASSAVYTCPLAMTDGAARAIELYGDDGLKRGAFARLTSRDPERFWTSGQWMTERAGGSDVAAGTATVAKKDGGEYRLSGTKWFTSATTAQMAMTLARIEGAPAGGKGLSLFYLELRDEAGALNGIRVNRLKDKLGTRALPTAELTLEGTRARLVGGPGDGIKKISSLFNITRVYNSCCAVATMRRAIALARAYALERRAFGRKLADHGLHVETLADLETEFQAAFHLTFRAVELLGREEAGRATPAETAVLRLLTPLAKLYTAKQAVATVSEALECFGGAGYVEDTGLPKLLRDAQVLSIWEGTTNVLSLDALRAIFKEGAAAPFLAETQARLAKVNSPSLVASTATAHEACARLDAYLKALADAGPDAEPVGARQLAFSLARVYAAGLLLEHAESERTRAAATRWCSRKLVSVFFDSSFRRDESVSLGLAGLGKSS